MLAGADDAADGFTSLFRSLYLALDERQISFLQGTLQLLLPDETAQQLKQKLTELGINATLKDL